MNKKIILLWAGFATSIAAMIGSGSVILKNYEDKFSNNSQSVGVTLQDSSGAHAINDVTGNGIADNKSRVLSPDSATGYCNPAIAELVGGVSVTCNDPVAARALTVLVEQLKPFALDDIEKKDIILLQQKTIKNLLEQKLSSKKSEKYDLALKALADGDVSQTDRLLDSPLSQYKKNISKVAELYQQKGALWFGSDPAKALSAYQRAAELEPVNLTVWNKLGHLYSRVIEPGQAIAAHEKLLALTDDKVWRAVTYANLGIIFQVRGDLHEAEDFYLRASVIDKALDRKRSMANAYGNLGNVYQSRWDLGKAETFYLRALAIYEAQEHKEGLAIVSGSIGSVYQIWGNLDKAEAFYLKALAFDEALGNKEGMSKAYDYLGGLYHTWGDLAKAQTFYMKALAIVETLGNKEGVAGVYANLGNLYLTQEDLDKAEDFALKAMDIYEALKNIEGMASIYSNLGLIYQTRGDLVKAEAFYLKTLAISEALDNKASMAGDYINLGTVHHAQGDLPGAEAFYLKALAILIRHWTVKAAWPVIMPIWGLCIRPRGICKRHRHTG